MASMEIITEEKNSALIASEATKWITGDITAGKISAVPGYNVGSEITSALFKIIQTRDKNGNSALTVCTRESIMAFLRDMAIQGLSVTRNQCYAIVYGNRLTLMRSYFGTQTVFQRMFPNLKVTANVLYEGDSYEMRRDEFGDFDYITNVSVGLSNRDKKIVAAYGSVIDVNTKERVYGCVMTMAEIKKSWAKAKTASVQNDFPQEMAKRTLVNRMLKTYINTSPIVSDPSLFESYNRTLKDEFEDDELRQVTPEQQEVKTMIHSRSKGSAGISAILNANRQTAEVTETASVNAEPPKTAIEEIETEDGEIIEVVKEEQPARVSEPVEAKAETKKAEPKAEPKAKTEPARRQSYSRKPEPAPAPAENYDDIPF